MMVIYPGRRLVKPVVALAQEACSLEPNRRADHYEAYKDIVDTCSDDLRPEIVRATPTEFFESLHAPRSLRSYGDSRKRESVEELVVRGYTIQDEKGDWIEAERLFRRALVIDPEYGHAWAHLGQVLCSKAKKYDEATEALEKAVRLSPNDWWAWFQLGSVRELQDKKHEAETAFKKVIELNPAELLGWIRYGGLLHDLGRYTESEEIYKSALNAVKGEKVSIAWANLGELYHYHLSRPHEAEEAYKKSLLFGKSEKDWVRFSLGILLSEHLGRDSEAVEYFHQAEARFRERVKSDPVDSQAWRLLGALMARDKARNRQAIEALRKALELDPTNARSRRLLFDLLLEAADFEGAERACRDEIRLKPSHLAWAQLGLLMESSGRFCEAEESYSKALEFDESVDSTWVHLGRLQFEDLKKTDAARVSLEKAVEIGGWKSAAWPYLLEVRLVQGEDIGSIVSQANRFAEEQREHPEHINRLAWRIHKSGREDILPAAEALARKALDRKKTGNWAAVHTLAVVLGRERKWHEAISTAVCLFDAATESEPAVRACIEFAISAASEGYASDVLKILGESKGKAALEPLEVGLRKFLKESPLTAQEISEVANDVADRIREGQSKVQPTATNAEKEEKAGTWTDRSVKS